MCDILFLNILHSLCINQVAKLIFERCLLVFFRHLNISYNLLKDLPRSGFYGLDTIETLDLSFNDLRSVDSSLFDNMNWLVDLRVSFSIVINSKPKTWFISSSTTTIYAGLIVMPFETRLLCDPWVWKITDWRDWLKMHWEDLKDKSGNLILQVS